MPIENYFEPSDGSQNSSEIQTYYKHCKQIFVQVSWITLGPTTGSGSGTVVGKCVQGSVRLVMKHM